MCDVQKTKAVSAMYQTQKHTASLAHIIFHVPALLAIYNAPPHPDIPEDATFRATAVGMSLKTHTSPVLNHVFGLNLHQAVSLTTGP
jgi:hypothetical protein